MNECKRVRIHCRCGEAFVASLSRQHLGGKLYEPCPSCGRVFVVTWRDGEFLVVTNNANVKDSRVAEF
jgi:hypothetical protein